MHELHYSLLGPEEQDQKLKKKRISLFFGGKLQFHNFNQDVDLIVFSSGVIFSHR